MGSYWHMDGPVLKDFGFGVHLAVFHTRLAKGGIFRLHQNTIISFLKKASEVGHSKALLFYSARSKESKTGLR